MKKNISLFNCLSSNKDSKILQIYKWLFLSILFLSVFTGCEKPKEDNGTEQIYYFLQDVMDYWYLWNDQMNSVDNTSYTLPQDMMDDMIVDIDKWSFVDLASEVSSYFNEGEDFGFGFFLGVDDMNQLRVIFVYNNTDAYNNGIRRGCIITKIDNTPVQQMESFDSFFDYNASSMKFDFIDNDGLNHTVTLTKETYNMNGVLHQQVFNNGNANIGYLVLNSFLGYAEEDLINAINMFANEGISELILDLRYNTGGYVNLAHKLANIIIPDSYADNVFYSSNHNDDRKTQYNEDVLFDEQPVSVDLNLNRIFFLTNSYTASASELLINGLTPFLDVYIIGDTTYGKPVAMYGFESNNWMVYPVTAKLSNADGYGDFFNGIAPTLYIPDLHKYNWGNTNEPLLSQALYYIDNGTFNASSLSVVKSANKSKIINGGKGLNHTFSILEKK